MRRKILAGFAPRAALCLTALVLAASHAALAAADNARWGAGYFPNVTLTTQDGAPVRFYDDLVKGKIVAINLIYTTCKYACPLETARLSQVAKLLGDRMGELSEAPLLDLAHRPALLFDQRPDAGGQLLRARFRLVGVNQDERFIAAVRHAQPPSG